MKHFYKVIIGLCIVFWAWSQTSHAQLEIPWHPTIYSSDSSDYVNAEDMDNPIRAGAYAAIKNPDKSDNGENSQILGIQWADSEIESHEQAKAQTLKMINNIINYALAWLSMVALIYLMYHGFIILTAAGDDSKYKEGMKGIKYAVIAIGGIGLSWIFVSTIFRFATSLSQGNLSMDESGSTTIKTETTKTVISNSDE